jgi:hypothetical protein
MSSKKNRSEQKRRLSAQEVAMLERFKQLPDEAAAPFNVCALISGISERTWRQNPPIPTFNVSANKRAANVGLLRKLVRGEVPFKNTA